MGKNKGKVKTYKRGKNEGQNKVVSGLDNIEKGILRNGMNLREKGNLFEVGGEGQPSEGGIKSFALGLSMYLSIEISGLAYSSSSSGEITDMVLGRYKNNSLTVAETTNPKELASKYGGMYTPNNILQVFHTHPNGKLGGIASSAPEVTPDYKNLQNYKPGAPNAVFLILRRISGQIKPYDYTHHYKSKK